MAHKSVIYVALFLLIAQVAMSYCSTSLKRSGMTLLEEMRAQSKDRKPPQKPLEDVCACYGHCEMVDGEEEEEEEEEEDTTEWFVKVLKDTLVESDEIYDAVNNIKEITFPINGHKNKDIAILHGLGLDEVEDIDKAFEPILAKFGSSVYPPIYEILSMATNVSKVVLEVVQINKEKAEEARKKAEEDERKAMDDARKAKAAKAKFTKSKSMDAKGSSNNSTPKPTSSKKSKSSPKRTSGASRRNEGRPAWDYDDR